ncbi:hypothetical protein L1286_23895, partial [Pseudoalteromonas sp. SMS1]|uniref:hypothetical protein n=1 Tax=Pseudoalteromonas sp. SMS1 TaxID=2908894 RepID=UPI001F43572A
EIDAQGYVTRFEYNAKGQLSAKTQLSEAVTNILAFNLKVEVLDAIEITATDRQQTYRYNQAGNLEYQVDTEGYATRFYYDAAGNQIATRQYKNKGAIGALVESSEDRISHQFYNGQGLVIGSLDADGSLTTYEYDSNGQKAFESTYLRHVRNHTIGNPLILPTGERVTSAWTYTNTGKVQSYAQNDGTYTYYTYDDMDNVVKKEIFEDRPPSVYNETTVVDDNFNVDAASQLTIHSNSRNWINTENGRVKFTRAPASSSAWPRITSNDTYDLKDKFNVQFELTTGDVLSDTYFYGGLDNFGAWGSTLDRHVIYFNGNVVQSAVVRNGASEPYKHLMNLTTNTTYIVRFESNGESVTLSVTPKDHPDRAVSVTDSSHTFTGKARVNFYNNPRPNAASSTVYFDNYSVSKPVETEFKGVSDSFDSGVMSQFIARGNSLNSISTVDGKVSFKRLEASNSMWPTITSKESYALNEQAKIQFEVTTGDSLQETYFYGGFDNLGSFTDKTLERHAVFFDRGTVQASVIRDGVEQGYKHLMNLTTNTTYVVRFEIFDGETVLTVMPKGQPENAASSFESSAGAGKFANIRFYNNPRPGAAGTEVYLDNYVAEKHVAISSERYSYDLLGRKVATLDGKTLSGENLNSPVALANWDVYDSTPAGAVMKAEYDEDYGGEVMTLTGSVRSNGYRLRKPAGENWDSTGKTIAWDMKYAEAYTVYISVNTPKGHRYITYQSDVKNPYISGGYAYAVMPSSVTNGQWHTVIRDLEADLKAVEPDNSVLNVNALLIRGSGKIGKVVVSDTTKAELAVQGIPVGAYLYQDAKLSAAEIRN